MSRINVNLKITSILAGSMMMLTGCAFFSNDGYQGGDHRGGGSTGILTGTETANKVSAEDAATTNSEDSDVYVGGDHRGGGPAGNLVE